MRRWCAPVFAMCLLAGRGGASTLGRLLEPVANGGFEELAPGKSAPEGWEFVVNGNARVSAGVDSLNAKTGKHCARLANASGVAPHVYGRLRQTVAVLPATEYVLSAWVKGEKVASGQHFTDWRTYTLGVRSGTFGWVKVSTRFATRPDQTSLDLGLNVVNTCGALWVDEVRLRPLLAMMKSKVSGVRGYIDTPMMVMGDSQEVGLRVLLSGAEGFAGRAQMNVAAGWETLARDEKAFRGDGVGFTWNTGRTAAPEIRCRVVVSDAAGNIVLEGERIVKKTSPTVINAQLDQVQSGLTALKVELAHAKQAGVAVDYPVIAQTVVERFLEWTREDVQRGEVLRASYAAKDMLRSLKRASDEVAAYRKKPEAVPVSARYRTGKLEIEGTSFVGDVVRGGREARGPVFFTGYGHFGQVRRDIEIFPEYGINIVQFEFGPSGVLTSEVEVSNAPVEDALSALERAAKADVMVNLLLSPHYFPQWALEKWPQLKSCRGGFIGYCIDAPEARAVIEKFLRHVIPQLRGRPALHSICLSNEPVYTETRECPYTKKMWAEYLARQHGSIEGVNKTLGTQYADFAAAPIPANDEYDSPLFYDWCAFNQERFAGWHKWMADVIHEMAPEIPVHAKIMPTIWGRNNIANGVDPEQFCALGQIAGNDCWWPYPGTGEWASGWHTQNQFYDLLRSMKGQPIFNSENHLSADRSTHYYAPEHFRTALWQGAVHGQGATTIWVWERTYDQKSDFYGNVMQRPGCAEEVGRTGLDLLRLAPEVTALQQAPAPVAILYSVASIARCPQYLEEVGRAYQALNFSGVKVDFVSEKQAAAGGLSRYKVLVIAGAGSVKEPAFAGIAAFTRGGGRLVGVGEDLLSRDEYGGQRAAAGAVRWAMRLPGGLESREIRAHLTKVLREAGAVAVECVDPASGEPVWGVEWLAVEHRGTLLINVVNLTNAPVRTELRLRGTPLRGLVDLITGKGRRQVQTLHPLQPALLRARAGG